MTSAPAPSSALGPREAPGRGRPLRPLGARPRLPDSLQPSRSPSPGSPSSAAAGPLPICRPARGGRGEGEAGRPGPRGGKLLRPVGGFPGLGLGRGERRAARLPPRPPAPSRSRGPWGGSRGARTASETPLPAAGQAPPPVTADPAQAPRAARKGPAALQSRPPRGAAPEADPEGQRRGGPGGREGAGSSVKRRVSSAAWEWEAVGSVYARPPRPSRSRIKARTRGPGAGPRQVTGWTGPCRLPRAPRIPRGPWRPRHDLPHSPLSAPAKPPSRPFLGRRQLPPPAGRRAPSGRERAAKRPTRKPWNPGDAPRTGLPRRGWPLSVAGGRKTGRGRGTGSRTTPGRITGITAGKGRGELKELASRASEAPRARTPPRQPAPLG